MKQHRCAACSRGAGKDVFHPVTKFRKDPKKKTGLRSSCRMSEQKGSTGSRAPNAYKAPQIHDPQNWYIRPWRLSEL